MVLDLNRPPSQPTGMMCPHCHVALSMSSREGIEIDFCPQCRGVWLDRGELDKIIERSAPEAPQQRTSSKSYRDDDDDDRRDDYKRERKYKKKKSWIAEIFDELT